MNSNTSTTINNNNIDVDDGINYDEEVDTDKVSLLRQLSLVEPTLDVPWSIDATSAIPNDIMDHIIISMENNSNTNEEEEEDTDGVYRNTSTNTSSSTNKYSTGCSYGRWYCLITIDNKIFVWYDTESVIRTTGSTNSKSKAVITVRNRTLYERKFNTPYCILQHNNVLATTNDDGHGQRQRPRPRSLLVAMTSAERPSSSSSTNTIQDTNTVYVYCANPITGIILLWKLSHDDLKLSASSSSSTISSNQIRNNYKLYEYKCNIFATTATSLGGHNNTTRAINDDEDDDMFNSNQEFSHYLTCIDVKWINQTAANTLISTSVNDEQLQLIKNKGSPCIVIGTSLGTIYWLTQSHVPLSFHIITVTIPTDIYEKYQNNYSTNTTSIVSSIFGRLFATPAKSKRQFPVVPKSNGTRTTVNSSTNATVSSIKSKRRKLTPPNTPGRYQFNLNDNDDNNTNDDEDNDMYDDDDHDDNNNNNTDSETEERSMYHIVSIQLLCYIQQQSLSNNTSTVTSTLQQQQQKYCYTFVTTSTNGDIFSWNVYPTETSYQSYITGSIIVTTDRSLTKETTTLSSGTSNNLFILLQQYCMKYKKNDTMTLSLLNSNADSEEEEVNTHNSSRITILASVTKSVIGTSLAIGDDQGSIINNNNKATSSSSHDVLISILLALVPSDRQNKLQEDEIIPTTTTTTTTAQWYWVQARLRRDMNETKSNRRTVPLFQILQMEWLHRPSSLLQSLSSSTVSSLRVYGCTIADNNVAYAGVGCVNQPSIVMALPFPKLDNKTSNDDNDRQGEDDREKEKDVFDKDGILSILSLSLLVQHELPAQQSLLYNMFVPDIVTTGISALDESGLGIRIRYIPQQKDTQQIEEQQNKLLFYTTSTNKNLKFRQHFVQDRHLQHKSVPILINYLYSQHRESYIKPDRVVPLPIILLNAIGTVELEQACVQYGNKVMNTTNDFFTSGTASFYSVPSATTTGSDIHDDSEYVDDDDAADDRTVTADIRQRLSLSSPSSSQQQQQQLQQRQGAYMMDDNKTTTGTYPDDAMEWHIAYIRFLQQSGIYKTLSDVCRWQLLQIGQQIIVYQALRNDEDEINDSTIVTQNNWQIRQLKDLRIYNVADWLYSIQRTLLNATTPAIILTIEGAEDHIRTYLRWLCIAVNAAITYREDYSIQYYDVKPNSPPLASYDSVDDIPIWTCKSSVQSVLFFQLQYWSQSSANCATATLDQVERIVQWALISFHDTYVCSGTELLSVRKEYFTCQQIAIQLIRNIYNNRKYDSSNTEQRNRGDELAFALSQAHSYFDGMCQISHDHERLSDADVFSLVPFLTTTTKTTTSSDFVASMVDRKDVGSQEFFPKHVLLWHIQNKLIGKALQYGQYCPDVLKELMDTVVVLKPYRWIVNVKHERNYQAAADNIIDLTTAQSSKSLSKINNLKVDLSIASLCTSIMEKQYTVTEKVMQPNEALKQRRRFIDQRMELINAQEQLTGMKKLLPKQLLSPKELLDIAIDQLRDLSNNNNDNHNDDDNRERVAFIALAICPTFDKSYLVLDAVTFVWYESIVSDEQLWITEFMKYSSNDIDDVLCQRMLHTTVFGRLYQSTIQVASSTKSSTSSTIVIDNDDDDIDASEWSHVVLYNSSIEQRIFDKLATKRPYLLTDKLRRLLQFVVNTATSSRMINATAEEFLTDATSDDELMMLEG